jgi:hypothetical protein
MCQCSGFKEELCELCKERYARMRRLNAQDRANLERVRQDEAQREKELRDLLAEERARGELRP